MRLPREEIAVHTLVNNGGFRLGWGFRSPPESREHIQSDRREISARSTRFCPPFLPGNARAGRQGGIINVASLASFLAGPHMGLYYASKAYVLSLSEKKSASTRGKRAPHGASWVERPCAPAGTEKAALASVRASSIRSSLPAAR